MLYFRMILTMAVGIYTSNVVLKYLGVVDYGIYNVIGGVVVMFSIISSSLTSAISRFLTFELGRGHQDNLRKIFSTALVIQIAMGLVVILIGEVVGIWFINHKMEIPADRITAGIWVLQCSLVTFMINMISVPYNAAIIAHERMQSYAYISLLEAGLKLGVAFLLSFKIFDSLITYAILLTITALIIRWIYSVYCNRHFDECHFKLQLDKRLMRKMLSFSGWNFIGSSSAILRDQGVNIILNLFFGAAVNAARGLAIQVNSYVVSFSNNFMMAVNPQIIKSYASAEMDYMFKLVLRSSKLSYFLLFFISLPLILEAPFVLNVWLPVVPDHTVNFVRLVLVLSLSDSISLPLQFACQATGRIKVYQLVVGGLQLLNFPLAYVLLKLGLAPESVFVLAIIISQICFFSRLLIVHKLIGLRVGEFLVKVYLKIIIVTIVASIIPLICYYFINSLTWIGFFAICIICVISNGATIMCIGCDKSECRFIIEKVASILKLKRYAES